MHLDKKRASAFGIIRLTTIHSHTRKETLNLMIPQNAKKENTNTEINAYFIAAIMELKISSLLRQCNIRKTSRTLQGETSGEKRTAFEIFQFLLLLAFQGCNLFRFLGSKKQDIACSKSTYNRFLNDCHYNWYRFVTLLAARVVAYFDTLTRPGRFRAFVLDDSVIGRKRSKKVELLAFIFDHVIGKSVKGFNLLTLGWTDAYSFVPVAFAMLSSAKKEKRINEMKADIDKRTVGYRNRAASMANKPDAAIALIRQALDAGINAGYILMDTWFTNEPFIKRVMDEGLDVIGMLKDNRQQYYLGHKLYSLKELAAYHVHHNFPGDHLGSVMVRTKYSLIPVKLVFVRNRNKRDEYIILLSTDCSLADGEIVRRYGCRWSIECCYKVCKSLLKLGKEFQPVNYDTTVSSTALVFTRFIILEWIRRKANDQKTICELFFVCCEDIRDMELSQALKRLMTIFLTGLNEGTIKITEAVRIELIEWYVSQPSFIKVLCRNLVDEVGALMPTADTPEMLSISA